VHQVTAGTHTFALSPGSRAAVIFLDANVWALFVPFDGDAP
jgi:hypothetical protein